MLGDKVKFLRNKMKIIQQQLSIDIGVSQSTIGMIEGNKQGASNEILIKLANELNTTVDYLLSDNMEDLNLNNDINETEIEDYDIRRIERARKKLIQKIKKK